MLNATKSAKLPESVAKAIRKDAAAHDTNGLVAATARELAYQDRSPRQRDRYMRRAKSLFPNPSRNGRGGRNPD
jgi:hypothetical protein